MCQLTIFLTIKSSGLRPNVLKLILIVAKTSISFLDVLLTCVWIKWRTNSLIYNSQSSKPYNYHVIDPYVNLVEVMFSLSAATFLFISVEFSVISFSGHPAPGVHGQKWQDQPFVCRRHHLQPSGRQRERLQGNEGVSSRVPGKKMLIQRKAGGKTEICVHVMFTDTYKDLFLSVYFSFDKCPDVYCGT